MMNTHAKDADGMQRRMPPTMGAMDNIDEFDRNKRLPPRPERFYWVDYFTLRQCQPDFIPLAIVEVIRDTGNVVVDVKFGKGIGNLERSFCVLELYAAVAGNCNLVVTQEVTGSKREMRYLLQ